MTLYGGRQAYAALAVQASPATPNDTPGVYVPYTDLSWDSKPDRVYETEHRGVTDKNFPPITPSVTTEGSMDFPAYPSGGLEHALYGVFGSYTSTNYASTPAYIYTFTQGSELPLFTMSNGLGTLNYKQYSDVVFQSMELSAQPKEKLNVKVSGFSYMMDKSNSALTPTYTTNNAFNFSDFTITYAGSTASDILSFNCTIDRATTAYYTAGHGLNYGLKHTPSFAVTGTFEAMFEDWDYVQDWMGATDTFDDSPVNRAMVLTWTGDTLQTDYNYSLALTLPKIYLDAVPLPFQGEEAVKSAIAFTAVYDASTSKTASAVLTTDLDSIA